MFTDLRFWLLLVIVDNNVLRVSFDAVSDLFSKMFILSSSNPQATRRAFRTDL